MSIANHIRLLPAIFLALLCLGLPFKAYAVDGLPPVIDACAANGVPRLHGRPQRDSDYTYKVVACVQYSIENGVNTMLAGLSGYMTDTVAAMFALALAVFAMHMFHNPGELRARLPAFLMRLGIVGLFSYSLGSGFFAYPGGMAKAVFDVENELISIVSPGYLPWYQLDDFFGILTGFGSCVNLTQGLLGLIAASLFSSTLGVAVFAAGAMMFIEVILFIFDVTYVYLIAILSIGFQLAISPLIVPLGIFFHTEKYVTKWLNMLLAAMLTPVMLFAFLGLFLGTMSVFIDNILGILGAQCPSFCEVGGVCSIDYHSYWKADVPAVTILSQQDPNFNEFLKNVSPDTFNGGVTMPTVSAALNPFLRLGLNLSPAVFPQVDFGNVLNPIQNWDVSAQLIFSFMALWIFASVMKAITIRIPQVAESIASSISGVSFQPSPVTRLIKGETDYGKFELGMHQRINPLAGGGGGG